MGRTPKPWYRKDRGAWFVTISGERHNLGPEEKAAMKRFHELMGKPEAAGVIHADASDGELVLGVIDSFLSWTKQNRAPRTYDWYRERLDWFANAIPLSLPVSKLRPIHVENWFAAHPDWSTGFKSGCVQACRRCFNWARKNGVIDSSPLAGLEKPPIGMRDNAIMAADYAKMIEFVPAGPFRDVFVIAWETGARPDEIARVEARHVSKDTWSFPVSESKGKRKARTVYLTPTAQEITRRWQAINSTGPIFRNEDSEPWNADSFNNGMSRLQISMGRARMKELGINVDPEKKLGIEERRRANNKEARKHAIKYSLYDCRHGFAHRMLINGMDPATLAELMGHADLTMIYRCYGHLIRAKDHLRRQLHDHS